MTMAWRRDKAKKSDDWVDVSSVNAHLLRFGGKRSTGSGHHRSVSLRQREKKSAALPQPQSITSDRSATLLSPLLCFACGELAYQIFRAFEVGLPKTRSALAMASPRVRSISCTMVLVMLLNAGCAWGSSASDRATSRELLPSTAPLLSRLCPALLSAGQQTRSTGTAAAQPNGAVAHRGRDREAPWVGRWRRRRTARRQRHASRNQSCSLLGESLS